MEKRSLAFAEEVDTTERHTHTQINNSGRIRKPISTHLGQRVTTPTVCLGGRMEDKGNQIYSSSFPSLKSGESSPNYTVP